MGSSGLSAAYRRESVRGRRTARIVRPIPGLILSSLIAVALVSCSDSKTGNGTPGPNNQSNLHTYLAGGVGNLQTYTVDHAANTFVVMSYNFNGSIASGGTIQDSGSIGSTSLPPKLPNGIYYLNITFNQGQPITPPPQTGNWLVEMPGEIGLSELQITNSSGTSTSFAPLAPTSACPSLPKGQSFQFVTIPKQLNTKSSLSANGWNPQIETAYGGVAITATGTNVQLASISQSTLPSANGGMPGAPINPAPSSATAACSPTFFGQTVSYPISVTVNSPGGAQSNSPAATFAISPSGFLVEDSGSPSGTSTSSLPPYQNLLGAGYGAIGLPKPAAALATSDLVAAQYQGILYGAAGGASGSASGPGFRLIGSFGYANLQTACPTLPGPSSRTILYGGEFANNDPSANASGNCDLAIDLGNQDSSNNGLYPAVTVYVSAGFPFNGTGTAYSFPAVAVAGKINGKFAVFLIGMDAAGSPAQPWGIYLLQSN